MGNAGTIATLDAAGFTFTNSAGTSTKVTTSAATTFSSIDQGGRYAYGNQPGILQWNLARFGEALLPLVAEDQDEAIEQATEAVRGFAERYSVYFRAGLRAKLGLAEAPDELLHELLALLAEAKPDLTGFFRELAEHARGGPAPLADDWFARWRALDPDPAAMDRVNPVYIPRNHLVEEALDGAVAGDLAPLHALVDVLRNPCEVRPNLERYALPGPGGGFVTFCGT